MKTIALWTVFALLALAVLAGPAWTADKDELAKYVPLEFGFCDDVGLPCAKAVLATTDFFYVVFTNDGKLLAITRVRGDKEETVWGKLPLRKGEQEL